nr:hypothetical protein [Tanacetum cinerariifolium]
MSSASSTVTYTSVYIDSEPRRVFWGADEELSDEGMLLSSDPEEDPEEYVEDEIKDGPVGYPMDGGDNGDDDDEAEVERLLAMPTPSPSPLTSLSPPSAGERESSTRGRGVDYGFADTVEAEMRHRGIGEVGYGIRDAWIDLTEAVPKMAPTTLEGVNTRVTELAELHEHDTQDLYALLEDA